MRRTTLIVAALVLVSAVAAQAQVLGTPVFRSPYQAFKQHEFNGYFSDPGNGADLAIEGGYRFARKQFDIGLTVGYLDNDIDGIFGVGVDGRYAVLKHSDDIPLDGALTVGFGALFSDGNSGFGIPIGLSVGRQIELENSKITFTPYAHPVFAPTFGDIDDGVQFGLGLGVDVGLSPSFDVRISGAIGDYEGVAIGVAWHK